MNSATDFWSNLARRPQRRSVSGRSLHQLQGPLLLAGLKKGQTRLANSLERRRSKTCGIANRPQCAATIKRENATDIPRLLTICLSCSLDALLGKVAVDPGSSWQEVPGLVAGKLHNRL